MTLVTSWRSSKSRAGRRRCGKMMCRVVRSERTSGGALLRGFVVLFTSGLGGMFDKVEMRSVKTARGVGRVVVDIAEDWASQM